MILRLLRGGVRESQPERVEDIVLGGVALAERYLDRGDVGGHIIDCRI